MIMDRSILNINRKIKSCIDENRMIMQGDTIIAGVSGGADSVCMLLYLSEYCNSIGVKVVVTHFNHMIRGKMADEDQFFVERLAKQLGHSFECEKTGVIKYAKDTGMGTEEAARTLRYNYFNKLASNYDNAKIAVAHNKNDRSETVLFNILRGTGLEGLKGISYINKNVIRPILDVSRFETERYCESFDIKYCIDNTNYELDYSRNRIRNELIPYLDNNFGAGVSERLIRLSNLSKIDNEFIKSEVERYFTDVTNICDHCIKLNINELNKLPRAIALRIIRKAISLLKDELGSYIFPDETGFNNLHTEAIANLLKNGLTGQTIQLPKALICKMGYEFLVIEKLRTKSIIDYTEFLDFSIFQKVLCGDVFKMENNTSFYNLKFNIEISNIDVSDYMKSVNKTLIAKKDEFIVFFDARGLVLCMQNSVLCIRFRKIGDIIFPFGSPGRKKIKDYFIDCKIPSNRRAEILMLACDSDIIWIPGIRRSSFALISEETERVIMIKMKIYRNTTGGEQFE